MAIKVIAQRREVKLGKNPGKKFVMRPDLYIPIQEKKVFAEASTHSGISAGVIKAAWDAAGEVIRTWATEGHSVPLPGLGTMRFGVRSKAVAEPGGREDQPDQRAPHHLHPQRGREGRAEEHQHPDHLSGRGRQRAEARDQATGRSKLKIENWIFFDDGFGSAVWQA